MSKRVNHIYALGPTGTLSLEQLPFRLNPANQSLLQDGVPVTPKLERLVFKTLVFLVENRGNLQEKDEIIDAVWGDDPDKGDEGGLQRHVGLIRNALGDDSKPRRYIETETGVGYRFVGAVKDLSHIPDEDCPWVGLKAVDEQYAEYFYGRDKEIGELVDEVEKSNLLVVVGFSGSGKSSLVRAGLIPALRNLRERGTQDWVIDVSRPTSSPIRRLAESLVRVCGSPAAKDQVDSLAQILMLGTEPLVRQLDQALKSEVTRALLIIDQFEEALDPRIDERERQIFFDRLIEASSHPSRRVHVLLTMRSDLHSKINNFHAEIWQRTTRHQFGVLPLAGDKLREIIERPAERVGLELDEMLPDVILEDLGDGPGKLPLLSHTMAELFKRREGTRLTHEAYLATGKVRETIANHAEEVYGRFGPREQEVIRRILISLTEVGAKPESDVRRRVLREKLEVSPGERKEMDRIIQVLVNERLLTISTEEGEGDSGGGIGVWVEMSHEALIRHWPQLTKWLNEKRRARRIFDSLDAIAQEWAHRRDEDLLYRGARLANALEAREGYAEFMRDVHREFLQASQDPAERRHARKQRRIVAGLAMGVALLATLSALSFMKWREAKRQRDLANSLRGGAFAVLRLPYDPELSLLLAIEAGKLSQTKASESTLRRVLAAFRLRDVYKGHATQVISVALSPDGKHLLTGGADGDARIWEIHTGQTVRKLSGHQDWVNWATFNKDGTKILTGGKDGVARIWDANTGQPLLDLRGHDKSVNNAVFSPDGTRVLTAGEDKTARVWDTQTGKNLLVIKGHEVYLNSTAYSHDGKMIATASGDRTARVWDAKTGKPIATLVGHGNTVLSVAFSADGKKVVTGSSDNTARVWETETWTSVRELRGHALQVNSAEFSADGRLILTASKDGTVRLWDAETGRDLSEWRGHRSGVNAAIFSADNRFIFTASGDGTARMWAVKAVESRATLQGHTAAVYSAVFSPDGRRLVTASLDGTARLWDAQAGTQLGELRHPASVQSAVFSPDGMLIATSSQDGKGRLWDTVTGQVTRELAGHKEMVHFISFSRDGTMVVTASRDRTARIWEVSTGQMLKELAGHTEEVYHAVFSPDGKSVATAGHDNAVRVWDVASGESRINWNIGTGWINSVAFSLDGKYLMAACGDQTARIWNLADRQVVNVLRGHELLLNYAEFSPDGSIALTASKDRTARIWELETGELLLELSDQDASVSQATFSPDGRHVATAGMNGSVGLYTCELCGATTQELIVLAEGRKTRELTPEERNLYLSFTESR